MQGKHLLILIDNQALVQQFYLSSVSPTFSRLINELKSLIKITNAYPIWLAGIANKAFTKTSCLLVMGPRSQPKSKAAPKRRTSTSTSTSMSDYESLLARCHGKQHIPTYKPAKFSTPPVLPTPSLGEQLGLKIRGDLLNALHHNMLDENNGFTRLWFKTVFEFGEKLHLREIEAAESSANFTVAQMHTNREITKILRELKNVVTMLAKTTAKRAREQDDDDVPEIKKPKVLGATSSSSSSSTTETTLFGSGFG